MERILVSIEDKNRFYRILVFSDHAECECLEEKKREEYKGDGTVFVRNDGYQMQPLPPIYFNYDINLQDAVNDWFESIRAKQRAYGFAQTNAIVSECNSTMARMSSTSMDELEAYLVTLFKELKEH